MSIDYNYWKNKYSFLWKESASREQMVKTIIERETGMEVEFVGTGAGTTNFINGQSEIKGKPDLHVKNTDIFIEVTGPFSDKVKPGAPLWFRPDKIKYAYDKRFETNEFLINNFKVAGIWYVIHFEDDTIAYASKASAQKTDYTSVEPCIRHTKEKYVEVKANTEYVSDNLQTLIDYIISYRDALNESPKNKIKSIRHSLNLTQKQFAEKYGIPLATVQDWEHGRRVPPTYIPYMCKKIANLESIIEELEKKQNKNSQT